MKRTNIDELGEFGLIDRLTKGFSSVNANTIKGVGDDAAVLRSGEDCAVVTSDLLVEGIHFDLSYMPLKHLGYKAVAVNISDVAAMNARPEQIVVSIGISNRFSVEVADALSWQTERRFDVICVTGAVDVVPSQFASWLRPGGRLFVIHGRSPAMEALLVKADGSSESLFETDIDYLRGAAPAPQFHL